MKIALTTHPNKEDWVEVRRRALITVYGKDVSTLCEPSARWKHRILEARHSPIRYLRFSFTFTGIPSNIATHLARHVHAQPYISSLRNDRQTVMDGDSAPRNTPVDMILDVNAEELMNIANKRLCHTSAAKTREVVQNMCKLAEQAEPAMKGLLVPMCAYHGGVCHEMFGCGSPQKGGCTDSEKPM